MPTVRYTVMDGQIIAEKRNGVRREYVPDAIGSTVALLDNTQTKTDTFSFWPYGEPNVRTGTTSTSFQFGGTAGYYVDARPRARYVRARRLDPTLGRWFTADPLRWLSGETNFFVYAGNRPTLALDVSGLRLGPCSPPPPLRACLWLPCETNTAAYGASGGWFANCASCVSSMVCSVIT